MSKRTPSKLLQTQNYYNLLYPQFYDLQGGSGIYCSNLHVEAETQTQACSVSSILQSSHSRNINNSRNTWQQNSHSHRLRSHDFEQQHGSDVTLRRASTHLQRRRTKMPHVVSGVVHTDSNTLHAATQNPSDLTLRNSDYKLTSSSSVPLFEFLPPLTDNLLYQNSYMLEGIKYSGHKKCRKHKGGRSRVNMDHTKLLRSLFARTSKPTDNEVIYGNAKIMFLSPMPIWEQSRIGWLQQLEQIQEVRQRHTNTRDTSGYGLIDKDSEEQLYICCLPFPKELLSWNMV